jgi:LDH2 family malate/lactate/ureidoglycolate dehydrogenase
MQMITTYLTQLKAGGVSAAAEGRVLSESGACLLYDGQNGLGQVIADRCTQQVLRLARANGIAVAVARNANHFGAAAYWAEKIVQQGCVGLVMCNACPAVPPWQGQSPCFGTNPLCAAVPSSAPRNWTLDMATTAVALGKLGDAAFRGETSIPEWWGFLGADGSAATSVAAAQAGRPSPFGRYKGSGLAMMVEILTAGLSGGPMATEIQSFGAGDRPLEISHTFLAIDPERFLGAGAFPERMERLDGLVKSSEPAAGYDEVLIAGEPEWRAAEDRAKRGIPIPVALWEQIAARAKELQVPMPAAAASND